MDGESLRRQAHRDRAGLRKPPFVLRDTHLVQNPRGMVRLCRWLGIPTNGGVWKVARRYLRWIKQNPQPRVSRRP